MLVYLFSYAKRENSTKRPTLSSGKKVNCYLKSRSTTSGANFEFQTIDNPTSYNYLYVPDFKTYYYVNDWSYEKNIWTAVCVNDVLATYKTEIGNSELYVLRSASSYDNDLIDNFYPLKPSHKYKRTSADLTQFKEDLNEGSIVIRVWGAAENWNKLNTMVMSPAMFSNFMKALFPDRQLADSNNEYTLASVQSFIWRNIGDAINAFLYDPMQYIQSIRWFPFKISMLSPQYRSETKFGIFKAKYTTGDAPNEVDHDVPHYELKDTTMTWNLALTIPKRDTATKRGNWTEQEPYAEYYLYNKTWGIIKLDSNALAYSLGSINLQLKVDLITGMATLTASAIDTSGTFSNILFKRDKYIAIDLSINNEQQRSDANNMIQTSIGAVGNAVSGNYPGLAADTLGFVGSFIHNMGPGAESTIGDATLSNLDNTFEIYAIFYDIADEDIALNGRPLRKKKKINNLSGYVLVQNGDVPIAGTREEQSKIKSYLEGGFYYE